MTIETSFVKTMSELRAYHKNQCDHTRGARRQALVKPSYATFSTIQTALTPEEAAAVEGVKVTSQEVATVSTTGIQNQIKSDTDQYKDSGGGEVASDEFKKRMEQKREAQKDSSNKMIDDMYDKAIEVGEKYPGTQDAILSVSDKIMEFFAKLYNEVYFWISNIVEKFVEWVKNAIENIKTVFNRIANWIGGWFK